ncbi:hypothetical protein GcM3_114008 [Golovinomyces cichoracearum]|uniref:Uncharacterized protein n=1 Tax=Golovinomyces cichoracearum TaxID=62708 RepID=A0A420I8I8_9PEZI|nr:hypothetical protein GcM3_114008 [Golovinomyces cichoracearum]
MNVVQKCKKHYTTEEVWNEFYAAWTLVVNLITLQQYQEYLLVLEKATYNCLEVLQKEMASVLF